MAESNKFESKASFEPVLRNFENSLRGIIKDFDGVERDKFPESAGSRFISKWMAHLRSILIGTNTLSKLDKYSCRERILHNGEAFIHSMVIDNTVSEEDMPRLYEAFMNILYDAYFGLRKEGHFAEFMRTDPTEDVSETESPNSIIED